MIGKTVAHYRISDKLGEGGMGEVYRAEDTRLGREVAIKVLPEAFTQDAERLARFEREARLLAALDHRSIAAIYGLDEVEGRRFLVMQLAEGETLQARIARGPVPTEEATRIALQIAEALEAAHAKGIIHRDLKPANVKVDAQGRVKVLDFGLAKALEGEPGAPGSSPQLTQSPTLTAQMTGAGVLLGTAAYMSPEQARGEAADRRADLWAFGVVLWEMLTGKQLFVGRTVSDTLAGVLRDEPTWAALPVDTPAAVQRLLRRCLEREPQDRLADATTARLELEDALAGRGEAAAGEPSAPLPAPVAWKRRLPWALLAVAAAALLGVLIAWWPAPPQPQAPLRLEVALSQDPLWVNLGSSVVLSPDGRRLAFAAEADDSRTLYLRSLDQLSSLPIAEGPSLGGPYQPFFSPDGQWLGFVTLTELKKVPLSGGTAITLCEVNRSRGASWGPDDTIVFATGDLTGLSRVAAAGGDPQTLTTLDDEKKEISHRWPQILPGGKAALFTVGYQSMGTADEAAIEIVNLDSGERKMVLEGGFYARYVPTGHLVFARGATLFAVPFDVDRLEVTGSPAPVVEGVTTTLGPGGAQYSFSSTGTLAYITGEVRVADYPILWVDRQGDTSTLWETEASYGSPQLSPDGSRLALSILRGENWDVWVYDLEREVATRLTFHDGYDADQIWSPDGEYLYFTSDMEDEVLSLYRKRADGSGEIERLVEGESEFYPISISPDGDQIAGETQSDTIDIVVFSLASGGEPEPFLATSFQDRDPVFSPNGRWIAYSSNESGRYEVYVRPYPAAGGRWQISDGGGRWPQWSGDGRELFYRTNQGVMAAAVDTAGETFRVGRAKAVLEGSFQGGISGISVGGFIFRDYAVTPDGRRFVMFPKDEDPTRKTNVIMVFNWFDELRRTLPTSSR